MLEWLLLCILIQGVFAQQQTYLGLENAPRHCLDSFKLEQNSTRLVECFHTWTQPEGHVDSIEAWEHLQPSPVEMNAIERLVSLLMFWSQLSDVLTGGDNCGALNASFHNPTKHWNGYIQTIQPTMNVEIVEMGSNASCVAVFYENAIENGFYKRGWFQLLLRISLRSETRFHLTAPHPIHEYPTSMQAGYLFGEFESAAWSFLVPNHHRNVVFANGTCIRNSNYTDPTHSSSELTSRLSFHIWKLSLAIYPARTTAHFQFHGHREAGACQYDSTFVSAGHSGDYFFRFRNTSNWYDSRIAQNSAYGIFYSALQSAASSIWNVTNPRSSDCKLRGATNVLGRHINKKEVHRVCSTATSAIDVTGQFVHIEQSSLARNYPSWALWTRVFSLFLSQMHPHVVL